MGSVRSRLGGSTLIINAVAIRLQPCQDVSMTTHNDYPYTPLSEPLTNEEAPRSYSVLGTFGLFVAACAIVLPLMLIAINGGKYEPCAFDERYQPTPCVWQADVRGNGQGESFIVLPIANTADTGDEPLVSIAIPHYVAAAVAR